MRNFNHYWWLCFIDSDYRLANHYRLSAATSDDIYQYYSPVLLIYTLWKHMYHYTHQFRLNYFWRPQSFLFLRITQSTRVPAVSLSVLTWADWSTLFMHRFSTEAKLITPKKIFNCNGVAYKSRKFFLTDVQNNSDSQIKNLTKFLYFLVYVSESINI